MNTEFRLMPEQASSLARDVDVLYGLLVAVSGVLILIIAFLILFFAIRYRRGSRANRTRHETHFFALELSWIVVPSLLSFVMFYAGAKLYFRQMHAPPAAMEIDCVARQWMWKFQNPEGHTEINDLHVPLNQPVRVKL